MASRIEPIVPFAPPARQRRPRLVYSQHLKFIRSLPCAITGKRYEIDAAHIRVGSRLYGKRPVGVGEKPSDRWCVPLQHDVHLYSQHARGNELAWWREQGIDNPFALALALFAASIEEDQDLAESILAEHRMRIR